MTNRKRAAKNSFTLMELLVVVVIIGLLAAMLLPALGKAREKGRRAQCMSNQRQILLAGNMYADDNNGWLPIGADQALVSGNSIQNISGNKIRYALALPYLNNSWRVFFDPSSEKYPAAPTQIPSGLFYGAFDHRGVPQFPTNEVAKLGAVSYEGSPLALIGDHGAEFPAGSGSWLEYSHKLEGRMVGYGDNHVAFIPRSYSCIAANGAGGEVPLGSDNGYWRSNDKEGR